MGKYIKPEKDVLSFTCPYCDTLSSIAWWRYQIVNIHGSYSVYSNMDYDGDEISISTCASCGRYHLWLNEKMIYPTESSIPMPVDDMPQDVKNVYLEARNVFPHSPRASAALLRLSVQLLCKEVGEEGKNINEDIASLVSKGLPVQIQQALDSIRVIGNNAVHPGEIDLEEHDDVAGILFTLLNIIVEQLITQPKKIQEIYGMLPEGALTSIAKRDK